MEVNGQMEKQKTKYWIDFIDKPCTVIFEDGVKHISKKVGIVEEVNGTHIILNTNGKREAILLTIILRVETKAEQHGECKNSPEPEEVSQ